MDTPSLASAHAGLEKSLSRLEALVQAHAVEQTAHKDVEEQMQLMATDRARLAEELERSADKIKTLEHCNNDVSRRLVTVMDTIRTVIQNSHSS